MDSIHAQLDKYKASLEGKIDFVGQDLAEQRARYILWTSAVVAFLVGFALQSLKLTFIVFGLGFLTTLGVVLPPLPAYTAHPVPWLAPLNEDGEPAETTNGPGASAAGEEARKDR